MNKGGTSRRQHIHSVIDSAPKRGRLISWSRVVAYVPGLLPKPDLLNHWTPVPQV